MFFQRLIALFFLICLGVHVYGLIAPFSEETPLSHVVHLVSYGMCLFAILQNFRTQVLVYIFGSIYPLYIHVPCAWSALEKGHLNWVCLAVTFFIPLGLVGLLKKGKINFK